MIRESRIAALVELLKEREVCLSHSCQLLDFESYMEVGGVPSRQLMESRGAPFTPFVTDQQDKINKVWDKAFLNLVDFGEMFAFGSCSVPTVYGPIAMRVRPEALMEADDIAICLKGAGSQGFDREKQSLKTKDDVDRLFTYPKTMGFPLASKTKSLSDLEAEFQFDKASHPEISLSIDKELISLEFVNMLIVDPYFVSGASLLKSVTQVAESAASLQIPIKARPANSKRRDAYTELGDLLLHANATPTLLSISGGSDISQPLRDWAAEAAERPELEMQWRNYAEYILSGTLRPMVSNS